MSFWSALQSEAARGLTIVLLLAAALALFAARTVAPEERRRLRLPTVFAVLHFVLLLPAAILLAGDSTYLGGVEATLLLFSVLALVGFAGSLVFAVLLPRVGVRAPHILRDVVVASAAVVGILVAASHVGFNLTSLIATSAVLTAVLGFSLQDTLGNIMGGLALQLDHSIRVGDWITLGNVSGRVSEIRWRYTALETRDWETVVVPNTQLMKERVTVLGRRAGEKRQLRRWVRFSAEYRFPPTQVIDAVDSCLQEIPIANVAAEPRPHTLLMDLGPSTCDYAVRYWLTDLVLEDPTDSEVRTRVHFALRRAGIPFSLPAQALFLTTESEDRRAAERSLDLQRRLAVLLQVELFKNLEHPDLERLAERLVDAPFARGETLTRQGAVGHWLYVVASGTVSVRIRSDGLEREIARLTDGSFFGEMSLMTGAPRSATVVALTDVACYRLDKPAFQGILRERPELAEEFARILAGRSTELERAREGLDAEAAGRRRQVTQRDLLQRIREFFGLSGGI